MFLHTCTHTHTLTQTKFKNLEGVNACRKDTCYLPVMELWHLTPHLHLGTIPRLPAPRPCPLVSLLTLTSLPPWLPPIFINTQTLITLATYSFLAGVSRLSLEAGPQLQHHGQSEAPLPLRAPTRGL